MNNTQPMLYSVSGSSEVHCSTSVCTSQRQIHGSFYHLICVGVLALCTLAFGKSSSAYLIPAWSLTTWMNNACQQWSHSCTCICTRRLFCASLLRVMHVCLAHVHSYNTLLHTMYTYMIIILYLRLVSLVLNLARYLHCLWVGASLVQ